MIALARRFLLRDGTVLGRRVYTGLAWDSVSQALLPLLRVALLALLSRLLSPADFGLFAMVLLVYGFFLAMSSLGMGTAIIQQSELSDDQAATAFWISALGGVGIAGLMFATAPLAGALFGRPEVVLPMQILALAHPAAAIGVVLRALLQRDLRFRALTGCNAFGDLVYAASAIALALNGAGYWALVVALFLDQISRSLIVWPVVRWRPPLRFSTAALKELWQNGRFAVSSLTMSFVVTNLDYMILGRWLGPDALGIYSVAYQLAVQPAQRVAQVIRNVLHPTFIQFRHDDQRLGAATMEITRKVALVLLPLLAVAASVAPAVLPIFLGPAWSDSVVLFQILCVTAAAYALDTFTPLFRAKNRLDLDLGLSLVRPVLLIALALGVFGVSATGVAGSTAVAAIASVFVTLIVALRLIHLPPRVYARSLRVGLTASLAIVLIGAVVRFALTLGAVGLGLVAVAGVVGIGATLSRRQSGRVRAGQAVTATGDQPLAALTGAPDSVGGRVTVGE